jgi:hypothetical protein
VHNYNPELKSQSLQYYHPTFPRSKKSKNETSTGKCMLTVFWDYREGYMVKGARINSKIYVKTLKRLKQQINCVHWRGD